MNKIAKKDKKGPGKLKEEKKKLADKGTKIKETKQEDIEQTKIEITEEKLKGKSLKTGRSVEVS